MTLVGKIFTVLILVMSIMFMAFSMMVFATHKQWKDHAGKLTKELAELKTAQNDAKALEQRLRNELAQEQAARKSVLAALQQRATKAETDLVAKQQELDNISAQHTKTVAEAEAAQQRLLALETETKKLRDELRTVQRDLDVQFNRVVKLTDDLNQAESLKQILDERLREATFHMAKMKEVMTKNGLTETSLVDHIPPRVEGIVLEVSDKDLIEISIGNDDGLKIGHTLDIYRDNTYLGRIVIRKTGPDRAVGQVQKEFQRGQIKRGDRVTTKFS
ncbi:MAG TPA: hypothetical protein VFB80_02570 [Pirellulaceae bacterium]|nr:hypothetical protein [Pirellulaceae bacterium]